MAIFSIIPLSLLLTTGMFAFGSPEKCKFIKTGTKSSGVRLKIGQKVRTLDFRKEVHLGFEAECNPLFITPKSGNHYLLLDIQGRSLGGDGSSGECAAGNENKLIWILLNKKFKIEKFNIVTYESCGDRISGELNLIDRKVTATVTDRDDKKLTFVYDNEKPDLGLLEIPH
jgi:hypothetical protein